LIIAGAGLLFVIPSSITSSASEGVAGAEILTALISDLVVYAGLLFALAFVILVILGYGQSILSREELLIAGFLYGSLAFLNTWDFPIYLSLFFAVLALNSGEEQILDALRQSTTATLTVLVLGIIFFLPWYPSFSSQAGGVLPHVLHPTRLLHFFIMFGTSLVPITAWLGWKFFGSADGRAWARLIAIGIGLPLLLMVLSLIMARLVLTFMDPFILDQAFDLMQVSSFGEAVRAIASTRLTSSWTALALGVIFATGFLILHRRWPQEARSNPDVFVILLIMIGSLLVLGPEFFYLRDQFGLRMNTIFKFYFAAWIMWGLAAAYAVSALWQLRSARYVPLQILIFIPLLLGLIYPVFGTWTKTSGFNPPFERTLNGSMHSSYAPDADRQAILWIDENIKDGVIAEAVGGSYTYFARVSAHTGVSTVLGWPGHESQWRGGYQEIGNREGDIRTLYSSPDWQTTEDIMRQYGIDYIYVGELERNIYRPLFEDKFETYLDLIYQSEQVRIYATRGRSVE
jgi:YYY domain-containing protein